MDSRQNFNSGSALDQRPSTFFNGKEFNPRNRIWSRMLDIKMTLYVVKAVILELNILSAVLRERWESGDGNTNSLAMLVYASLFTWFVCEYLYFERIHLYAYDLFCKKVGFKLAWGCLCFYPYFYAIGTLPILYKGNDTKDLTNTQAMAIICLFYAGWILTRGTNLQKYYYRRFPDETFCLGGLITQRAIQDRVLISGFWGLAKHVNYHWHWYWHCLAF